MGNVRGLDSVRHQCHPRLLAFLDRLDKLAISQEIAGLFGKYVESLRDDDGALFQVVQVWRDPIEQSVDLQMGYSKVGPFQSFHAWGLAVDLMPAKGWEPVPGWMGIGSFNPKNLDDCKKLGLGNWFEKNFRTDGATWGGSWDDFPDLWHFEIHYRVPVDNSFSGTQWWLNPPPLERISEKIKRMKIEAVSPPPPDAVVSALDQKPEISLIPLLLVVAVGLGLWWFNER